MNIPVIISVLYFISSASYFTNLWFKNLKDSRVGFYVGALAFIFHTYYLFNLTFSGLKMAGGVGRSLFILAWFIPLVFFVSRLIYRLPSLGAFIFPLAFIGTVQSVIIPKGIIEIDPSLNNPWILIHIILIFLGEAFFAIAFVAGILYIFEEREIKGKHFGKFLLKLPSLNTLDKVNHLCFMIGFPLMTLGLAIGFFAANQIWGPDWKWDNKETWSVLTWILYALLLNFRLSLGWKGKRSAVGAIIGFGIILIALLSGYLFPTQHTFSY